MIEYSSIAQEYAKYRCSEAAMMICCGFQKTLAPHARDGLLYSGNILGLAAVKWHMAITNHRRGAHENN